MAARWKALEVAPALVEKARTLWDRIGARKPRASEALLPEQAPAELRLAALERRVAQLEGEAAASFEVVASIAQQHSQLAGQHADLVHFVDGLQARSRLMLWMSGALGLGLLAVLAILLSR